MKTGLFMQITKPNHLPPDNRHQRAPSRQGSTRPRLTRLGLFFGTFDRIKRQASSVIGQIKFGFRPRPTPAEAPVRGPLDITPSRVMSIVLHYAKLDPEDRLKRFNGRMTLKSLVERYTSPGDHRNIFFGFESRGRVVALAELCAMDDRTEGGVTELGVSVLKSWQHRGLGEALLREATDRVCVQAGRDLVLYVSPQNRGMASLTRKLGGERVLDSEEPMYLFRGGPGGIAQTGYSA